jgi:putative acetyltransferase
MDTLPGVTRIRPESPIDHPAVYEINRRAFGQPAEAGLVEVLRRKSDAHISLVAERDGQVIGHILFTPVTIDVGGGRLARLRAMGLAPMAVLPEFHRQGIGSELVRRGLTACRDVGYEAVVVLGHPDFYPRFGFVPASTFGLTCEYNVPDPVFMVIELVPGALQDIRGLVEYAPEFANV